MSDHLRIWEQVEQPPDWALKPITGGRLKGKTDINPQWRLRAMTEVFGPCGDGWWFTVDKQWLEPGANNEVCAFVNITLYTEQCEKGIPGNGGAMFIANEAKGLHTTDEAYKMATTDALSVAMKCLGVAAVIYQGGDATKYSPNPASGPPKEKPAPKPQDKAKAIKAFHAAWGRVVAEVPGAAEADVKRELEHVFLHVNTDKDSKYDPKHDYMDPLTADALNDLTAILNNKDRRKRLLKFLSEQLCATEGCNKVVTPDEKEHCSIVGLDANHCKAHAGDAKVVQMTREKLGGDDD